MKKVIEAFVNEESYNFHGYKVVKQPEAGFYVVYDKKDNLLCTVQDLKELENKWNDREGTERDYSPAQIARAKKLKVWQVNCFDKHGGHVTNWEKFKEGK